MILKKKKMNKFIIMIMVFLLPLTVNSDVNAKEKRSTFAPIVINATNFPDENFRNYVSGYADKDSNGLLSEEEIQSTTVLYLEMKRIANLQGIEYFTALTSLRCADNKLTSLDVSKNTALTELECYYNKLTSLDVSKNTALTYLKCDNNQLTSLDVSKNIALTGLEFDYNQITSLDVSKNTALTRLDCYNNQLTSLDVSNNPGLRSLYCQYNQLTSLDVSKNPALTRLECQNNNLVSLYLPASVTFDYLDISNQQAKEIYMDSSGNFDLLSLDNKIDANKISNPRSGANLNGTIFSSLSKGDIVGYSYDSGLGKSLSASIKVIDQTYAAIVQNGTGSNEYLENDIVTIKADDIVGKRFKEWQINSGSITLGDKDSITTTFTMPKGNVKVTALYDDILYPVVVNGGTGSDNHKMNDVVTIEADAPALGMRFKEWQIVNGNITLANVNSATTTFTMPASNVEVKAIYEDALYPVVVNGGIGSNDYLENDVVTIKANAPALGKQFKEWQINSGSITLTDKNSTTTTFTMPASNVEVKAIYEDVIINLSRYTYEIGSKEPVIVTCSSKLEDFLGIYMDNELIDASHYTKESGSTIITLSTSYLETLSVGKHTIRLGYKDGVSVEAELAVKAKATEIKPEDKPSNPTTPENKPDIKPDSKPSEVVPTPNIEKDTVKTGDQTNIIIPTVLLIMTGTLLITLRKKYKNS